MTALVPVPRRTAAGGSSRRMMCVVGMVTVVAGAALTIAARHGRGPAPDGRRAPRADAGGVQPPERPAPIAATSALSASPVLEGRRLRAARRRLWAWTSLVVVAAASVIVHGGTAGRVTAGVAGAIVVAAARLPGAAAVFGWQVCDGRLRGVVCAAWLVVAIVTASVGATTVRLTPLVLAGAAVQAVTATTLCAGVLWRWLTANVGGGVALGISAAALVLATEPTLPLPALAAAVALVALRAATGSVIPSVLLHTAMALVAPDLA